MIKIRVPASSANLGPGFDCLGLALDIWNEIQFEPSDKFKYVATGEGSEKLNKGTRNLLTKAFANVYDICGRQLPGFSIQARNEILMSSGLGSSAAAILAGLFGANEILDNPLDQDALLKLANEMEGHPDNVAAALYGGLVVSVLDGQEIIARRYDVPRLSIVVIKPIIDWPTRVSRAVLPKSVSRSDAIFNIGRAVLVVDALRDGDLDLLQKVMDDRLHQSYRLKHISGGLSAFRAARQFGAAALSGAGPSIIAFVPPENADGARKKIAAQFEESGITTRGIVTTPSLRGIFRV